MMPTSLNTHTAFQAQTPSRARDLAMTAAGTATMAGPNASPEALATRCGAR
jgi:hypothetical protein